MTVSLIITCHNQEKYLSDLLQSLQDFSFLLAEAEILILDSSDTPVTNTGTIPVHRIPNLGPSVARNKGAALAQGEWIVFCDADDFVSPHMIHWIGSDSKLESSDICFFPFKRYLSNQIMQEAVAFYTSAVKPDNISLQTVQSPIYFLEHFFPVHAVAIRRALFKKVSFRPQQWFIEDVRFYIEAMMSKGANAAIVNDVAFTSFHRDFPDRVSLSASNDEGYWKSVCSNYNFLADNLILTFQQKVSLCRLVILNFHIVDASLRPMLATENRIIWNYFFGIPRLFRQSFLYNGLLLLFAGLKKIKGVIKHFR